MSEEHRKGVGAPIEVKITSFGEPSSSIMQSPQKKNQEDEERWCLAEAKRGLD